MKIVKGWDRMIFYFSGTGNSLYAAKKIAEYNNEKLVSIAAAVNNMDNNFEFTLKDNEAIGFVFPIYAWGPPKIVVELIEKLKLNNYRDNYIFAAATCGANIGNTMKVIDSALKKKELSLSSAFSLVMPNNYIVMGDVDSKEVEVEKLKKTEATLQHINEIIAERSKGVYELVKGPVPFLFTSVIHPAFMKGASHTEGFYAEDKCTGCGICEKVCSFKNIKVEGKPKWGRNCTQCHACISYCPVKAVQYSKGTIKKGRYINPNISVQDMIKGI
jgi:ferredoxin/flavodoxin